MDEPGTKPGSGPAGNASAGGRGFALNGRNLPKVRLEAFSDGVFAIAITLLVLELKVPPAGTDLTTALLAEWPAYLGYLISFAFIGASWVAHNTTTTYLRAVNPVWMRLNLLVLLAVSLLPFTTSLMATHLNEAEAKVVTVLFGVNLTIATALMSVMIRVAATTDGMAADEEAAVALSGFERERRVALFLQAGATLVAFIAPVTATVVFLGISFLLLFEPLWRLRRKARAGG